MAEVNEADTTTETARLDEVLIGHSIIEAAMCRAIFERYGDEGLAVMRDALTEAYSAIIPTVARRAGARTGDGTIEDWAKVERYLCHQLGLEYEIEVAPDKGSVRVYTCPLHKPYGRVFPDICQKVFIGAERAIARTINPDFEPAGLRYLPSGGSCCELVCERKSSG